MKESACVAAIDRAVVSRVPTARGIAPDRRKPLSAIRVDRGEGAFVGCSPSIVYKTYVNSRSCRALFLGNSLRAADWPQWRGPNRDNKVLDFTAPENWPKSLTKKWKTRVGLGDASPVMVGEKVYVFTRQGDDEVIVCLDAGSGKELWKDQYAAVKVTGPGSGHPDRQEVRIVAGATRAGATYCALRLRAHDDDQSVVGGVDLVPQLLQLLGATLEEENDQ